MFKWFKKFKCAFNCCIQVEIDNTDGKLDQVDYNQKSNKLRIH